MKYRIFTTSERAWEGMLAAIREAKSSVYMEMYILDDDSKGGEFFAELERAARRGIRVIAILDVVGSLNFLSGSIDRLRETGAEVIFSSSFFRRLHRKVLVIDESSAFVGGVNVGKKYARWRDLQVSVTGPVVAHVLRSFARLYKKSGGKGDIAIGGGEVSGVGSAHGSVSAGRRGAFHRARLWFVDHGIGKRRHDFRRYYSERLKNARESIMLVTPYLFPPRWLIAEIHQAIIRGVRVDILLPASTDYRIVNSVNRAYASCLANLGANIFYIQGMNHAKAMIVDRAEGVIGSQNLDLLSFNVNIEAGVFFSEPDMVRDLSQIIEGWKRESQLYDPAKEGFFFRWYDAPTALLLRGLGFLPLR